MRQLGPGGTAAFLVMAMLADPGSRSYGVPEPRAVKKTRNQKKAAKRKAQKRSRRKNR